MPINCVKSVNKPVEKVAKKSFKIAVEKIQDVYKTFTLLSFTQVLQSFSQQLLTFINTNFNLLKSGFTHFPQTSTITTNIYKEMEEIWK